MAFIYIAILLGVVIAIGGITESELRHHDKGYLTRIAAAGAVGGVLLAIFLYLLYLSTLIHRIRFDSRGILYTVGRGLRTKMPWKDVRSVSCYEREGGFTMSETIRGIEIKGVNPPTSVIPLFSRYRDIIKIESNIWGQESLDKAVYVIRFYNKKYDFKAKMDEWESGDKFMFARSGK